jgi:hypothetical protein
MGRHVPIQIGPYYFKTKKAAKDHIQEILSKYHEGERITGLDESFLRDLLDLHPRAADKIGTGVSYFVIEKEDVWQGRHFSIVHTDRSRDDFSYIKCIDGPNLRNEILGAMRSAVVGQILGFRDRQIAAGAVACPFTGEVLRRDTSHVDHIAPNTFYAMVNKWLKTNGLALEDVAITPPEVGQVKRDMTDETQVESWRKFHLENASLRLISKLGNLSYAKKSRGEK